MNMHIAPAGWLASLSRLALFSSMSLVVSSCNSGLPFNAETNVRVVNGRPSLETRTSMNRVRNDLYNYIDGGHLDFRVHPEPPLSFAFPSAYYTYHVNHVGGAVSKMGLEVDSATFGPFSRAPIVQMPNATTPRAKARESHVRRIHIMVLSNYFEDGNDFLERGVFRQPPGMGENARQVDLLNGYKTFFYRSAPDRLLSIQRTIILANQDIANTSLYAFPLDSRKSVTQRITCEISVPNCRASFVYYGRLVEVVFDKAVLFRADELVRQCKRFLDAYRLKTGI